MCREPKRKRTLLVKRMFEPDRMSIINLQTAYEQLIPPHQYRVISSEQSPGLKAPEELPLRKEAPV
jgi:hypothetical protein